MTEFSSATEFGFLRLGRRPDEGGRFNRLHRFLKTDLKSTFFGEELWGEIPFCFRNSSPVIGEYLHLVGCNRCAVFLLHLLHRRRPLRSSHFRLRRNIVADDRSGIAPRPDPRPDPFSVWRFPAAERILCLPLAAKANPAKIKNSEAA